MRETYSETPDGVDGELVCVCVTHDVRLVFREIEGNDGGGEGEKF